MFDFLSRKKIVQSRRVEPSITPFERVNRANRYLKKFIEKSFDKSKSLYELDTSHPRFVVKENAELLIEKMLEKASRIEEIKREEQDVGDITDHTTSDEFNILNREIYAIYREIRNIGEAVNTGHRLYSISDAYPYVDDSLGGVMGRLFALPYRGLNERRPEETHEVSEFDKIEGELAPQDFSYLSTLRKWFRVDARVDPVAGIQDEEDTKIDMPVIARWDDPIDGILLQTQPIVGDVVPIIACG